MDASFGAALVTLDRSLRAAAMQITKLFYHQGTVNAGKISVVNDKTERGNSKIVLTFVYLLTRDVPANRIFQLVVHRLSQYAILRWLSGRNGAHCRGSDRCCR